MCIGSLINITVNCALQLQATKHGSHCSCVTPWHNVVVLLSHLFGLVTGVMCLDFHPQHPNLLAVGLYDGSVSVFDVRRPTKPLYSSTAATGKHTDPVWEIFWQVCS